MGFSSRKSTRVQGLRLGTGGCLRPEVCVILGLMVQELGEGLGFRV